MKRIDILLLVLAGCSTSSTTNTPPSSSPSDASADASAEDAADAGVECCSITGDPVDLERACVKTVERTSWCAYPDAREGCVLADSLDCYMHPADGGFDAVYITTTLVPGGELPGLVPCSDDARKRYYGADPCQ